MFAFCMGQSRMTTDSPAAGATGVVGRLLEIALGTFLQGFRASRRSSVTDKVLRDRLEEKRLAKKKNQKSSEFLLVGIRRPEVIVIGRVHPADDLFSAGSRSGHLSDFRFSVHLKKVKI